MDESIRRKVRSPQTKGTLEETHLMCVHMKKVLGVIVIVAHDVFATYPAAKVPEAGVTSGQVLDVTVTQNAGEITLINTATISWHLSQSQLLRCHLLWRTFDTLAVERMARPALMANNRVDIDHLTTRGAKETF